MNMTKRIKATYSPEFKLKVTQQVVDMERSVRYVAQNLNLGKSTVEQW